MGLLEIILEGVNLEAFLTWRLEYLFDDLRS